MGLGGSRLTLISMIASGLPKEAMISICAVKLRSKFVAKACAMELAVEKKSMSSS